MVEGIQFIEASLGSMIRLPVGEHLRVLKYSRALALRSTSFALKKYFMAPSMLQTLLILVFISEYSLIVSAMKAPRYLKHKMK